MRALLQRVERASVRIGEGDGVTVGAIGPGLMVLLGVGPRDDESVADALAGTVAELRIFRDENRRTNRSLIDVEGEALVVSQFTLYADTRRGRRPGFTGAAAPELAERCYLRFIAALRALGVATEGGRFGAEMRVELVNDGPFTVWLDSDVRSLRSVSTSLRRLLVIGPFSAVVPTTMPRASARKTVMMETM